MGKKEPHIRVLEGFVIAGGINQEVKPAGFKRLHEPLSEVQTCRILPNSAIIGRILHTNRNGELYGFFR